MLIGISNRIEVSTILLGLIFLQYFSYFMHLFERKVIFVLAYFIFGILCIVIYFFWDVKNKNYKKFKSFIIISTVIVFLLSSLVILFSMATPENSALLDMYYYSYGIMTLFCAYYMALSKRKIYKGIFFFYWLMTIVIIFYSIKNDFGDPGAYDIIFDKSSRNYVSMIYIQILIFLHLAYYKEGILLPIRYSIIVLLGCLILFGRTGIAISGAIVLFSILQLILSKKTFLQIKIIWFCILFFLLSLFLAYYNIFIDFFSNYTSFSSGTESIRSLVVEEYWSKVIKDINNALFSTELNKCCYVTAQLNFNTHNSFILGHLRYGILHTIISLLIYFYILASRNITFIFFATLIYFRYWFDQVGLFSAVDIVLFYIVSCIYTDKKL